MHTIAPPRTTSALATKGSTGVTYLRFPGLMNGYQPDQRQYVVTGNVEGGGRMINFHSNQVSTPSGRGP